jgi:NADH:ubiquinone oxidoreductase subunit F (NADH-binding)
MASFRDKKHGMSPASKVHARMTVPFSESERENVLNRLEASGLRGRGGGWFPVHRKWRAVLAEGGPPFVIANGGEGEPGSIKDRYVMRRSASEIVDGILLALRALDAEHGYVYLKASFDEEARRLRHAIDQRGAGDIVSIHRGDDSYVGGEETALLESIEGRKPWPRPKPPRPAAVGLFGRPTLVQNVDTLARVTRAVELGDAFAAQDTITITIWGDVARPGGYEIRPGRTVRDVVENDAGRLPGDYEVFPNGAHAVPLRGDALDVPITPEALKEAGSSLGLASFLVIDKGVAKIDTLRSIARFFERESCGQCPPCSLGAANLRTLVEGAGSSTRRLTPQAAIRETVSFMSMHGYCGHGRAGAFAVSSLFERWQSEVIDHLRDPGAAAKPLARDPFGPGSPEREALETFLRNI